MDTLLHTLPSLSSVPAYSTVCLALGSLLPSPTLLSQGDGSLITVEPGLIGGEVNRILAAHQKKHKLPVQYKIGPDPSSIDRLE